MSAEDIVSDAAGAMSAERFVEISYDDAIPNNVALSSDKQLQRALEGWRPKYLDWWTGMGPVGFQQSEVYLRTAVGVDPAGWAKFGFVKMPTYRWGILLAPKIEGRTIPFGRHKGEPAWQEVPGEHRALLRRLIVVQGDTEPASVEQQRYLGATAPSLYDMRNLFQVNVEEGRHLVGDGLSAGQIFRQGRPRGGAGAARASERTDGQSAHLRGFQRGDAGLAVVLHVHLLHRPRRQDAARRARRKRLRSALAHLPLHADGGGASHVRRRDGRAAHDRGDLRGDGQSRHQGSATTSRRCASSA